MKPCLACGTDTATFWAMPDATGRMITTPVCKGCIRAYRRAVKLAARRAKAQDRAIRPSHRDGAMGNG